MCNSIKSGNIRPTATTLGNSENKSLKLSLLDPWIKSFKLESIGKQINWPSNYAVLYSAISHGINSAIPQKKSSKVRLSRGKLKMQPPVWLWRKDARTGRHRHMDLFNFNRISEEWTSYKSIYKTLPINLISWFYLRFGFGRPIVDTQCLVLIFLSCDLSASL